VIHICHPSDSESLKSEDHGLDCSGQKLRP
jgi:hypothetical protein